MQILKPIKWYIYTFMLNLTLREFDSVRVNFEKEENRAPFFAMSTELLKRGLKNEAFVLLLAT